MSIWACVGADWTKELEFGAVKEGRLVCGVLFYSYMDLVDGCVYVHCLPGHVMAPGCTV